MKRSSLLLACLMAAACGNDAVISGPDASVYDGFWTIERMESDLDGIPVTLNRDNKWFAVRGDLTFADGATTVAMRWATLIRGTIYEGALTSHTADVTVYPDLLVIEDRSKLVHNVWVYETWFDGDVLYLEWLEGDTRNAGVNPPPRIVLTKSAPFEQHTVGVWNILSMTQRGEIITPEDCAPRNRVWVRTSIQVTMDSMHMLRQLAHIEQFADPNCFNKLIDADTKAIRLGMAEEGKTWLRTWSYDPAVDSSQYANYAMTPTGNNTLRLDRVDCLPTGCEDEVPEAVFLERETGVIVQPGH